MSEELAKGWEEWSKTVAGALALDLSSTLGSPVSAEVEKAEMISDVDVRSSLPSDTTGCFANLKEGGAIALLLGGPNALTLAKAKNGGESVTVGDDEKSALEELGKGLAGVLQEASMPLCSIAPIWEETSVAFMADSTWEGGEDRVPSGDLLRSVMVLTPQQGETITIEVILAQDLCDVPFDKMPAYRDSADDEVDLDAPRHILSFCSDAKIAERIAEFVSEEDSHKSAESVSDFLERFDDDDINVGIIEVKSGDEFWLPLLGDLKGRLDKPLIVVLEEPKTWRVVQCGRLGLFGVLSPEFSGRDFQGRVRSERLQPAS
ncbi:MAG: hypothetical protein V3W41_00485 [Planctomycetota bacterium]